MRIPCHDKEKCELTNAIFFFKSKPPQNRSHHKTQAFRGVAEQKIVRGGETKDMHICNFKFYYEIIMGS